MRRLLPFNKNIYYYFAISIGLLLSYITVATDLTTDPKFALIDCFWGVSGTHLSGSVIIGGKTYQAGRNIPSGDSWLVHLTPAVLNASPLKRFYGLHNEGPYLEKGEGDTYTTIVHWPSVAIGTLLFVGGYESNPLLFAYKDKNGKLHGINNNRTNSVIIRDALGVLSESPVTVPTPAVASTSGWSQNDIEYCLEEYGKNPWELPEIPLLPIEASKLASYIPHAQLIKGIMLSGYAVGNELIPVLKQFYNLTKLELWTINLNDSLLADIVRNCPNLTAVAMYNNDTVKEISCLGELVNLTELGIVYCHNVSNSGLVAVAEHCHKLKKLDLWHNSHFNNEGLIAVAKNCPELSFLRLYFINQISDDGLIAIAENCPELTRLEMNEMNFTNKSLMAIAEKCKKLDYLYMRETKVDNSGMEYIAEHCPELIHLTINSNRNMTDIVLKSIAENCKNLTYLSISSSGFRELAPLLGLHKLETLRLSGGKDLEGRQEIEDYLKSYTPPVPSGKSFEELIKKGLKG